MRKKKLTPLEEKFELFTFFISDIENYIEKRWILEKLPEQFKFLDEIERGSNIHALIRKNNLREFERIEQERRDKIDRKRKGIREVIVFKEITDEDIENEILQAHEKSIKTKQALNPSYFGQKSFNVINTIFSCENEIKELSFLIKKKIKNLLIECYENVHDVNKETKKLVSEHKDYFLYNKNAREENKKEKYKIFKNKMYNNVSLQNFKIDRNSKVFELLFDIENNSKLINQFINDNEIKKDKNEDENNINSINRFHTLSNTSIKNRSQDLKKNKIKNKRYNSNHITPNSKREYYSISKSNLINKQLLRPKTASSRVETTISGYRNNSNNLTNFTLRRIKNPSSLTISKSNNKNENKKKNQLLSDNIIDFFDINEINVLEKMNFDKNINNIGRNYDYTKLMELRSTKLNSKNPIKYPLFVISKNLLNSKGLFDFPIVNSKNKSKEFRIYKKNKQKDKDFIKFQNI